MAVSCMHKCALQVSSADETLLKSKLNNPEEKYSILVQIFLNYDMIKHIHQLEELKL